MSSHFQKRFRKTSFRFAGQETAIRPLGARLGLRVQDIAAAAAERHTPEIREDDAP